MSSWGFGQEAMISNLSFADRGLDRVPTIHEGPGARSLMAKGIAPQPKPEWHHIDQGHTRAEANQVITEINKAVEADEGGVHRLGSNDARDAGSSGEGGVDVREGIGRGHCNGPAAEPPFRRGAEAASRDPEASADPIAGPPFALSGAGEAEPTAPFLAGTPALRIGRRVRRIFRELTMLRDTLRARLAPARTREPFLATSTTAHPREAIRPPMNSRRSETGQREE